MAINPSDILLTGQVAVVTGGGTGIGRGIAAGLAAFGASVAIWERDAGSCAESAESIGALGIVTDVRDAEQVDAALAQTAGELGPVRILVNNAGGVFASPLLGDAVRTVGTRCTRAICATCCCVHSGWRADWSPMNYRAASSISRRSRGARRPGVCRVRGRESRRHQLHPDRVVRAGARTTSASTRSHPTSPSQRDSWLCRRMVRPRVSPTPSRWVGLDMSTKSPGYGSFSGFEPVGLCHRADDSRRRWHSGCGWLVPPPADRRRHTRSGPGDPDLLEAASASTGRVTPVM